MKFENRWFAVVVLLAFPVASRGADAVLNIRINNQAPFDEELLASAETILAEILGQAAVEVRWADGALAGSAIVVNLVSADAAVMGLPRDTAGATAVPSDVSGGYLIWVFRPNLERVVDRAWFFMPSRNRNLLYSSVLAGVMLHEIGHLLLRSRAHPDEGLMTKVWRRKELELASTHRLRFSRAEAGRLRAAVQARVGSEHAGVWARGTPDSGVPLARNKPPQN